MKLKALVLTMGLLLMGTPAVQAQDSVFERGLLGMEIDKVLDVYGLPQDARPDGCTLPVNTKFGVKRIQGDSMEFKSEDSQSQLVLRMCLYHGVVVGYSKRMGVVNEKVITTLEINSLAPELIQKLYQIHGSKDKDQSKDRNPLGLDRGDEVQT